MEEVSLAPAIRDSLWDVVMGIRFGKNYPVTGICLHIVVRQCKDCFCDCDLNSVKRLLTIEIVVLFLLSHTHSTNS